MIWFLFASLHGWSQDESDNDQHEKGGAEDPAVVLRWPEGVIVTREGRRYQGRVSFFENSLKIEKDEKELASLALEEIGTVTIEHARGRDDQLGNSGV